MNEDGVLITIIMAIALIFLISLIMLGVSTQNRIFDIEQFLECQEETQNQEWCIDKFLR